jgi:putative DNA primase/helicase
VTVEPTAEALARLLGGRRKGRGWLCRCPAHDDHDPSLSIEDRGGRTVFVCRAGCKQGAVIAALRQSGLWPELEEDGGTKRRIVATYSYRDATGELRYQVVRSAPKDFRQRRPNGAGFVWNMEGVKPLPYRLPELLADPVATVFIVEGEKDADTRRNRARRHHQPRRRR